MEAHIFPTSFEQIEAARFLEMIAIYFEPTHPWWADTARQHAANARLAADYLRRPCHECAR